MLIEARDKRQFLAAGFEEGFTSANAYFFESFETIRDKRGADNEKLFDSSRGKLRQFEVGVGRQPGITAKARLESYGIFFLWEASFLRESGDSFEALGAVTGGVRWTGRFTTVLGGQAMAAGRIRFANLALRQAVEAEKDVIEILF